MHGMRRIRTLGCAGILVLASLTVRAAPAGAVTATPVSGSLTAVACTSPASCTAVGSFVSPAGTVSLAEAWNGSTWSVEPTPNPAGGSNITLTGIACGSAGACLAVGGYFSSSNNGELPLAESWNGTSWTIQSVPLPAGARGGSLNSVSCGSATACTAVGFYADSGNANVVLAESWNGASLAVQAVRIPAGATTSTLGAVSCSAAPSADCEAVGWYFRSGALIARTLAEGWNGASWTIQATPKPRNTAGGSFPAGISCGSASSCTSVGSGDTSTGNAGNGWAQAWDGTAWSNQAPRVPKGAVFSQLAGVSCSLAPATACTAVGVYGNGSAFLDYAEGWNGTAWLVQKTPEPAGATAASLAGVSCSSPPGSCVAVGSYTDSSGVAVTLAEGWNGTKWSVQKTPVP